MAAVAPCLHSNAGLERSALYRQPLPPALHLPTTAPPLAWPGSSSCSQAPCGQRRTRTCLRPNRLGSSNRSMRQAYEQVSQYLQ